jgi:hypothetical protein
VFHDPARVNSFMNAVEGPFLSRRKAPSIKPAGLHGDKSQQQQEELIEQIDHIEDAKHLEIQKDLDKHHDDSSHPPEGSLPSGPECGGPCP